MKRYLFFCMIFVSAVLFTGAAAGASSDQSESFGTDSNILIAYFTWTDNTVVEDEEAALDSALAHYESVGDSGEYESTNIR